AGARAPRRARTRRRVPARVRRRFARRASTRAARRLIRLPAVRVIEQARLWFREGTSDKVYEVDLVEVAPGQHVVNFRYGRRGGALKDGTKTPLPLPLDKARGVFQKLVDEKLAGGYRSGPVTAAPPAAASPPSGGSPYRTAPAQMRSEAQIL